MNEKLLVSQKQLKFACKLNCLYIILYSADVPKVLQSWLFEMDIVKSSVPVRSLLGEMDGEEEHTGHKQRRTAGAQTEYIWPGGRIPYVFDSSVSE